MRFTIRDLLWLTVVVALGVAWSVDRNIYRGMAAVYRSQCEQRDVELAEMASENAMLVNVIEKLKPRSPSATDPNPPPD